MQKDQSDEEEVGLPRAALNKLIKDTMPNVRVANETRDLIYACCLEFIRLLSTRANQLCADEQRKTISHEHMLKAMEQLGFGPEYAGAADTVMDNCRIQAARRLRRQNSRLDKLGIPEEELLRQQQELFDRAREEQAVQEQVELQRLHAMMLQNSCQVYNPNLPSPLYTVAAPQAPVAGASSAFEAPSVGAGAPQNGDHTAKEERGAALPPTYGDDLDEDYDALDED